MSVGLQLTTANSRSYNTDTRRDFLGYKYKMQMSTGTCILIHEHACTQTLTGGMLGLAYSLNPYFYGLWLA